MRQPNRTACGAYTVRATRARASRNRCAQGARQRRRVKRKAGLLDRCFAPEANCSSGGCSRWLRRLGWLRHMTKSRLCFCLSMALALVSRKRLVTRIIRDTWSLLHILLLPWGRWCLRLGFR